MTRLFTRTLRVLALVAAIPAAASAQTITFDDLSCGSVGLGSAVPAGYAGFTFGSLWTCYDMTDPGRPSAAIGANVSGKNVAFNRSGSGSFFSRSTPFTFTSAYITGTGSTYDFEGWLGATKVYDKILGNEAPATLETFNFVNVDKVVLTRTSGGGAYYFDNIQIGAAAIATPEPASIILLGSGLLAVAAGARRRRS